MRKRPTPEDAGTACRVLLDGLARDADVVELLGELAPPHPWDDTFPGEVFLRAAADALNWCGARRADPLPLEGLRERFLPERAFRGRQDSKFQYAVLAATAIQGGTEPDLLEEAARWQAGDFWQYALSRQSPASAPRPAGRACRWARRARTWPGALAPQRHNDHYVRQADWDDVGNDGLEAERCHPAATERIGSGTRLGIPSRAQRPALWPPSMCRISPVTNGPADSR